MTRYEGHHRCCPNAEGSNLHGFSWADRNDDGKADILEIADIAVNFGKDHDYWDHLIFGIKDNEVDIQEVTRVALYLDHGLTTPTDPAEMVGLDLNTIDPFKASP